MSALREHGGSHCSTKLMSREGFGLIPENRVQDDPERHGLEEIESRDYNIH